MTLPPAGTVATGSRGQTQVTPANGNLDLGQRRTPLEGRLQALTETPLAERSSAWVAAAFQVGHPAVVGLLRSHSEDDRRDAPSRALARRLSDELTAEQSLRNLLLVRAPHDEAPAYGGLSGIELTPEQRLGGGFDALAEACGNVHVSRLTALVNSGVALALITPLDGCAWPGSIAAAVVRRAASQGRLKPEALEPLHRLAGAPEAAGDANEVATAVVRSSEASGLASAVTMTEALVGHSPAQLSQWTHEVLAGGFGLRDHALRLHRQARRTGIIPYAIVPAHRAIAEAAASYLDIPPWRTRGFLAEEADGRLAGEVPEAAQHLGSGAVMALTGSRRACLAVAGVALENDVPWLHDAHLSAVCSDVQPGSIVRRIRAGGNYAWVRPA